jgi:hypothetical protein
MRAEWWDKINPDAEPDQFITDDSNPSAPRPALAIVLGGLIAGVCDLTYAITFYAAEGVKAIRIPQSIASGLLGRDSYQGGWASAAIGIGLHFLIAFSAAAIYYLASRKISFLLRWASVCGPLYGAAIYFFMRRVVLPLSAAPHFESTALSDWADFGVHVFLIGLPIALLARHYSSPPRAQ